MIIEELYKCNVRFYLDGSEPQRKTGQVRYCSVFTPAYLLVHFVNAIAGRRIEMTRRCFVDLHRNEVLRFASRLRQLSFGPVQDFQKFAIATEKHRQQRAS